LQRGAGKEPGTVVLIEPRKHNALGFVVKNLLENLGPEWKMILFHGTENEEWVKNMMEGDWLAFKERITLSNLGTANLVYPGGYNTLLKSKEFHEKIPTELFLVAQTDSMICPQNKDLLDKFLQYDYIGAPWNIDIPAVGNGGFSLRRKSKMLEIIEKYPSVDPGDHEDRYYARNILEIGGKVPSKEEAREFSQEQMSFPMSFGVHAPWKHGIDILEDQCTGYSILKELQE